MKKRLSALLTIVLTLALIFSASIVGLTAFAADAESYTINADIPQGEVVVVEQNFDDIAKNTTLAVTYEASYYTVLTDRMVIREADAGYNGGKYADFNYANYDWETYKSDTSQSGIRGGKHNINYPIGTLYTGTPDKTDHADYIPSKSQGFVLTLNICNVTGFGDEYLWISLYDAAEKKNGYQIRTNQFDAGVWYEIRIEASSAGTKATATALTGENAGTTKSITFLSNTISSRKSQFSINFYPVTTFDVSEERMNAHFKLDNFKLTTTAYPDKPSTITITEQDYENIKTNTAHTYDDRNARTVPVIDSGIPELGMVANFDYSDLTWSASSTNGYGGGRYYDSKSQVLSYVPTPSDGYTVTFNFRNVTGYGKDDLWVCVYNGTSGGTTQRGFRINTAQFDAGVWYEVSVTNKNNVWTATKTAMTGEKAGTTTELTIQKNTAISSSTYNRVCYAFYNVTDTGTDANGNPTARRKAHYQLDNFKLTTERINSITTSISPDKTVSGDALPILAAYDAEGKLTGFAQGTISSGTATATATFDITNQYSAFANATSVKALWWENYSTAKPYAQSVEIGNAIHPDVDPVEKDTTYLGITEDMNPSKTGTMSVLMYTVPNTYDEENIPAYGTNSKFDLLYVGQSNSLITEIPYDKTLYTYTTEDIVVVISNGTDTVTTILEEVTPPKQTNIVLQLGSNKSEINFTWFSLSDAKGVVYYAEEGKLVDGKLPADAKSATALRTESVKTNYFANKATITGLEAGKVYYYVLENGNGRTEPKAVKIAEDGPFTFAFAGDAQIGRGYGTDASLVIDCIKNDGILWNRTLEQMVHSNEFAGVDFLMSAGDQTNNSLTSYEDHELQWDAYSNHEVLLTTPQVTVLGNHDPRPYSVYSTHTNAPNMLTKPDGSYYGTTKADGRIAAADYYFTYNNALFLVLNTNTFTADDDSAEDTAKDKAAAEEHAEFIARVMELTAELDIDWTIVLYHQSPYGSSYHGNYTSNSSGVYNRDEQYAYINIRQFLVPVLYENGVDLVLSGHDHCYTRTHVIKPAQDENGNYIDESIITPYEDGSYVYADGTTTPSFVNWKDKNGKVYTDLKVSSKPVSVTNPDGIVHITGATASGTQVNPVQFENHYAAATSEANTRQLARIDVSDGELKIVVYNLGGNDTNNITVVDTFTIYQTEEVIEETKISAASVVLGSDLAMKYFVTTGAYSADELTMRFTMNGKITEVSYDGFDDGYAVFTFLGITPQCMGDNIKAELLADGEVIAVKDEYSIRANALSLLSKNPSDKLSTLLADMLNYGAEAQLYLGYKTDKLANRDLTVAGSSALPTEADDARSVSAKEDAFRYFISAGVHFDYINSIYVKLSLPNTDNVKVLIGEAEAELISLGGNAYIAYSEGVAPAAFDSVVEIKLVYGETVVHSLTYSVNSYTYAMQNDADIGRLAIALYRLGASTDSYKAE